MARQLFSAASENLKMAKHIRKLESKINKLEKKINLDSDSSSEEETVKTIMTESSNSWSEESGDQQISKVRMESEHKDAPLPYFTTK